MEKLISFDLKADFGFFRKPDTNNTINLSYNIVHKPALLGIFGAITGLDGYKEKGKLPEYYNVFKNVKVGIQPLEHEKGNYQKTNIKYSNTVGYANKGSNFLTEEMTLISPQFRVFVLLDVTDKNQKQLYENIANAQSEYVPYFGKNEFTAWWEKDSFREYDFESAKNVEGEISVKSIFLKSFVVRENSAEPIPNIFSDAEIENPFMYFERLPKDFDLKLMQYELGDFVYSTYNISNGGNMSNLYFLKDENSYVQLL